MQVVDAASFFCYSYSMLKAWMMSNTLVHAHTRSFFVLFFFPLFPPLLFFFFFQFEQLFFVVVGKRTQWMEEGKDRKRKQKETEREKEGERKSMRVRSDGRLNVGERANPLFVLFWHSSSPPMMYVRERDAANVSHANTFLACLSSTKTIQEKKFYVFIFFSMFNFNIHFRSN